MKKIIATLILMAMLVSSLPVVSLADENASAVITETKGVASVGGLNISGKNDATTYSGENLYASMGNGNYASEAYGVIRYALSEIPENQDVYLFTIGGSKQTDAMYGLLREKANFEFGIYDVIGVTNDWVNAKGLTGSQMSATGNKEDIAFKLISTTKSENDEEIVKADSINTTLPQYYNGYRVIADITAYMKEKIAQFKASEKTEEYVTLAFRPIAYYDWATGEEIKDFFQPVFKHVGHGDGFNMYPRIRSIDYPSISTDTRMFSEITENGYLRTYVFGDVPSGVAVKDIGVLYSNDNTDFDIDDVNGDSIRKLPCVNREFTGNKFGIGFIDKREDRPAKTFVRAYYKVDNSYIYGNIIEIDLTKGMVLDAVYNNGRMYPEEFSIDYDTYYLTTDDGTFADIELTLADGVEILEEKKATAIGETTEITVISEKGVTKTVKFVFVEDSKGTVNGTKSATLSGVNKDNIESVTTNSEGVTSNKQYLYMTTSKNYDNNICVLEYDISNVNIMANKIEIQLSGYNKNNPPVPFDVFYAEKADGFEIDPAAITYNNSITNNKIVKKQLIASADTEAAAKEIAALEGSSNYYKLDAYKFDVTDCVRKAKLEGKTNVVFLLEVSAKDKAYQFYLTNTYTTTSYKPTLSWEYVAPPVYIPFENGAIKGFEYPYGVVYPETYSKDYDDYYILSTTGDVRDIKYTLPEGIEVIAEEKAEKIGDTTKITVMDKEYTKTVNFHFVDESTISNGSSFISDSATLNGVNKDSIESMSGAAKKSSLYVVDRKTTADNVCLMEFDISGINIMTSNINMQLSGFFSNPRVFPFGFDIYDTEVKDGYDFDKTTATYNNVITDGNIIKGDKITSVSGAEARAQAEAIETGSYYKIKAFDIDVTNAVRKAKLNGKSVLTLIIEPNGSYWEENPEDTVTAKTFYLTNDITPYESYKPVITWSHTAPPKYNPFPMGTLKNVSYNNGKMYPEAFSSDVDNYYLTSEDGTFKGLTYEVVDGVSVIQETEALKYGDSVVITVMNEYGEMKDITFTFVEKTSNTNGIFSSSSAAVDAHYYNKAYSYQNEALKTTFWLCERKTMGDSMGLLEFDISDVNIMADNIKLSLAGKTRTSLPPEFAVYSTIVADDFVIDPATVTYENSITAGKVTEDELIKVFDPVAISNDIAELNKAGSGSFYKVPSLECDVTEAVKEAKLLGKTKIVFLLKPTGTYWIGREDNTSKTFYMVNAYGDYATNRAYAPTLSWSFN